jgi:hypothetical protein
MALHIVIVTTHVQAQLFQGAHSAGRNHRLVSDESRLMSESIYPRIVFSERLSTGVVVHFENDVSVFFPAAFLYEQRNAQSNTVFSEDEEGEHPQQSEANRYRFVINIGRRDR